MVSIVLATLATSCLQNPPTADNVAITVAPGDSVLIPYAGSDPDGDLFGFFRTGGLSNPSAGFLLESCVCRQTYAGTLCSCITFFAASQTFAGSVTFTYKAVDATGLTSADATVTISSTVQARTAEQILDEIEFIVLRGTLLGGDITEELRNPLLTKVEGIRTKRATGNFQSAAFGQAGALCNQIDAGIQAARIVAEAANVLPPRCEELLTLIRQESQRPANRSIGADGFVKGNPCVLVPLSSVELQERLDCVLGVGEVLQNGETGPQPDPCYKTRDTGAHFECSSAGPLTCIEDFNGAVRETDVTSQCFGRSDGRPPLKCIPSTFTLIRLHWIGDRC